MQGIRLDQQIDRLASTVAERAYDYLTRFRFVQRYVKGKSVALVSCEDVGYGDRLLTEISESVVRVPLSSEASGAAVDGTSGARNKPPALPCEDDHFDVAVVYEAVEYLEHPEDLVKEAKRVLKRDGLLVISAPDKQAYYNDRNYTHPAHKTRMYVAEFREMLERHFAQVLVFRQGATAGSLIYRDSGDLSPITVESAAFGPDNPRLGLEPPTSHSVIAVCSDVEIPDVGDERAYLLLDRTRRLLDECDDYRDDIRLLRDEIKQMQETEVQAFRDAIQLRNREIASLRAQLESSKVHNAPSESEMERIRARNINLEEYVRNIESSRTWKALGIYRSLRLKLNALLKI